MRITRRHLQISLATLWLLDGALQCQPSMFGPNFARKILSPARHGLPAIVASPLHVVASLESSYPALANGGFALIQIAIAVGLLTRRFTRVALFASIVWALSVWIVGEGLGGVTTGATMLSGAPGAALLYGVIAILAWPTRDGRSDHAPSWLALPAWCGLWLAGAVLQLVAGNNSAMSLTMMLRGAQVGSPGWIAGIDRHLALIQFPSWTAAALIAVNVLVAIWALVPGWTRSASVALGVFMALVGWLLVQGLGDLTSGQSTDLNSGPLIVLLAVAVVGAYPVEARSRSDSALASIALAGYINSSSAVHPANTSPLVGDRSRPDEVAGRRRTVSVP